MKYACNRKFTEVYVCQKLSKQSVAWQSYCKNKMVQLFLTQTVQSIPHYFVTYTGNKSQNYRTTFLISNYYKTIYIFDQKPKDVKLHYKWEQTNMKTSKLPIYTANLAYAGVTKCTTKIYKLYKCQTRCSAIAERPRCRCIIVFAERLEVGDNILRILYVYLQPLWYNRHENLSNSVKKRKIRAITAFTVIQCHQGRYQSKARMRFPISD